VNRTGSSSVASASIFCETVRESGRHSDSVVESDDADPEAESDPVAEPDELPGDGATGSGAGASDVQPGSSTVVAPIPSRV